MTAAFPGRSEIREALRHLPVLEGSPEGLFRWEGGERRTDGSITMPHGSYSQEVLRLEGDLYRLGSVRPFDWPAWAPQGERLQTDPGAIDRADLTDLVKLLTLHVRRDRFVEGHLSLALERGWLLAIFRRLQAIDRHLEEHPDDTSLIEDREGLGADRPGDG